MKSYITFNHHHIGQSHILKGSACEDYSASYIDGRMAVSVISDGHGDKNCFRSAEGARLACEIAIQQCKEFHASIMDVTDVEACDFHAMLHGLEESIITRWKETVLLDAMENPFSEEELEPLNENVKAVYRSQQRMERAYGCTLIVAVITPDFWYGLQIGDGTCVAVYEDGVYVAPIPADEENCCGNHSTSLCNTNAIESFRHYFRNRKPSAVFVISDGMEESFDEKGLYHCFYSICHWVKNNGIDFAKEQVKLLLPKISEGGSGDDVSVSAIIDSEGNITPARETLTRILEKVEASENQLKRFEHLLEVSEENLRQKKEEQEKIRKEIERVQKQLAELMKAEEEVQPEIDSLEQHVSEVSKTKQLAFEQVEKAHKYQANAAAFWKKHLEPLGLWNEKNPSVDCSEEERPKLFISDLDNTLIHSSKYKQPQDICIEEKDGEPQGFMPAYAYHTLPQIRKKAHFIPVTSRSIAQFSRIQWSDRKCPEYALVTNGAILLKNGLVDHEWLEESKQLLKPYLSEMEEMYASLSSTNEYKICRIVDGMYLYLHCHDEQQANQWVSRYEEQCSFQVVAHGRKVYFFPPMFDKGMAVKRLQKILHPQMTIAAGDSVVDLPMLEAANIAVLPEKLSRFPLQCEKIMIHNQEEPFADFVCRTVLQFLC